MNVVLHDTLTARTVMDGAAFNVLIQVYTDTSEPWVLTTPTTLRYRIDDPDTGEAVLTWTTLTPDDETTLTITGTQNTLSGCVPRSRRQLTVEANHGLSTCAIATRDYWIRNLVGV